MAICGVETKGGGPSVSESDRADERSKRRGGGCAKVNPRVRRIDDETLDKRGNLGMRDEGCYFSRAWGSLLQQVWTRGGYFSLT